MTYKYKVQSANAKRWLMAVLSLTEQGATLPEDASVFKGKWLRTVLESDKELDTKENRLITLLPPDNKSVIANVVEKKEEKKEAEVKEEQPKKKAGRPKKKKE